MRKAFYLKPVALAMASVFLATGCGEQTEESDIYTSVDDCVNSNPELTAQCQTAYQQAIEEHSRTGPKFSSENDCEYEFGPNQCQTVTTQQGSFFMPFMAGYMVSQLLSPRPYYSQPLYTSFSRNSPFRSRWATADGHVFNGDIRNRKYNAPASIYKAKPTVNRTIKRGGFGSSVRAKSSWGSSSRSGSWGG
jgi:uncharacterized protein YgiB involved in biofilm formation